MAKLYDAYEEERYCYLDAYRLMKAGYTLSRPEWDGFHFIVNGHYFIMLKDKTMLVNPKDKQATYERDWMVITPTAEALELIVSELTKRGIEL